MDAPTVISLTSIPSRFDRLGPTLDSLLRQDLPATAIVLNLPQHYRRFPGWDGTLPQVPPGITIRQSETDFGPATKLLPSLLAHAGQELDILFCDDDCLYPPGWHRAFKQARALHPDACIAGSAQHLPGLEHTPRSGRMPRMRRWTRAEARLQQKQHGDAAPLLRDSGYADLIEGWAGAMVRPRFFQPGVFEIPPVLWTVDDIWLSGQLERTGTPIWALADAPPTTRRHAVGGIDGLVVAVIEGHDRDAADLACIRYCQKAFGIWRTRPAPVTRAVLAVRRWLRRAIPRAQRMKLLALYARLRGW